MPDWDAMTTLVLGGALGAFGATFAGLPRWAWRSLQLRLATRRAIQEAHQEALALIPRLAAQVFPNGGASISDSVARQEKALANVTEMSAASLNATQATQRGLETVKVNVEDLRGELALFVTGAERYREATDNRLSSIGERVAALEGERRA